MNDSEGGSFYVAAVLSVKGPWSVDWIAEAEIFDMLYSSTRARTSRFDYVLDPALS